MDKELARHLIRVAFRVGEELQGVLESVRRSSGPEEYRQFALGVAAAIDAVNVALTNRALSAHPELADEVEANIARHDKFI